MAKEDKIGALWLKKNERGPWFSGVIKVGETEQKIVVFKNGYKQEERHPDYVIYKSKPRDAAPADEPFAAPPSQNATGDQGEFQDDIPF